MSVSEGYEKLNKFMDFLAENKHSIKPSGLECVLDTVYECFEAVYAEQDGSSELGRAYVDMLEGKFLYIIGDELIAKNKLEKAGRIFAKHLKIDDVRNLYQFYKLFQ